MEPGHLKLRSPDGEFRHDPKQLGLTSIQQDTQRGLLRSTQ